MNIGGKTAENSMVTGLITKCTAKVCSLGKTVDATQVSTSKIRSKVMVSLSGPTIRSTMVNGITANNTDKVSTQTKTRLLEKVSGLMARDLNGLIEIKSMQNFT